MSMIIWPRSLQTGSYRGKAWTVAERLLDPKSQFEAGSFPFFLDLVEKLRWFHPRFALQTQLLQLSRPFPSALQAHRYGHPLRVSPLSFLTPILF